MVVFFIFISQAEKNMGVLTKMTLSKSETSKSAVTWGTERRAFWKIVTGCWAKCKKKKKKPSSPSSNKGQSL